MESDELKLKIKRDKFFNELGPYLSWINYSTDMGSKEARWKYSRTAKGRNELKKKFGEKLDQMPEDWEEMKKKFIMDDTLTLKNFLKFLADLYSHVSGVSL